MTRSQLFTIFSLPLLLLLVTLLQPLPTYAIKFTLPAQRYPQSKCIWNTAHTNTLVIVTANVGPGANQRVDVEIVDSGPKHNVYLAKKGIKGEARLAITTHSEGEVGVCFKNHIEGGTLPSHLYHNSALNLFLDISYDKASKLERVVDLDVDIGADAVDYKYGPQLLIRLTLD
jgi:hypothetical protein